MIFSGQKVDENKKSTPSIEDFDKIATWNLTNAITLWDCSSAICSWRCKSFSSLGLLAKKKPKNQKRHIGIKSFWWSIQFICVFMRCLWNIEEISRVNTMEEWSKCTKYDFIPMLKSLPNSNILWKSNWWQR